MQIKLVKMCLYSCKNPFRKKFPHGSIKCSTRWSRTISNNLMQRKWKKAFKPHILMRSTKKMYDKSSVKNRHFRKKTKKSVNSSDSWSYCIKDWKKLTLSMLERLLLWTEMWNLNSYLPVKRGWSREEILKKLLKFKEEI